jgi:hypothetical protein
MDQSKKTMRHFYCRDVLWETFEQMANDFDCSIDYLINESMRYYARSKNYPAAAGAAPPSNSAQPMPPPAAPSQPPRRPAPATQPPPAAAAATASMPRRPAPPTPAGHLGQRPGPTSNYAPAGGGGGYGAAAPGYPPAASAPPRPGARRAAADDGRPGRVDAVPHVQRPALPGRQGPVHHRPRLQDQRPGDQGRQHLAQARRRSCVATGPSTSKTSGRPTASTTRACASTTSASTRATCFSPVRLRTPLHV